MSLLKPASRFPLPALLVLSLCSTSVLAQQPPAQTGSAYVGAFVGGGRGESSEFQQVGIAFKSFGPLHVNASGTSRSRSAALLGIQAGYRFGAQNSGFRPALEFEGLFLDHTRKGQLINPSDYVPNHTFENTLPMDVGVALVNALVDFGSANSSIRPYFGLGVGGAIVAVSGAYSAQLNPAEPGINHFNSDANASSSALAFQAKAGLRFTLRPNLELFTEYRHLRLSDTDFDFGPTVYASHDPTSAWQASVDTLKFNLGVAGLQYRF